MKLQLQRQLEALEKLKQRFQSDPGVSIGRFPLCIVLKCKKYTTLFQNESDVEKKHFWVQILMEMLDKKLKGWDDLDSQVKLVFAIGLQFICLLARLQQKYELHSALDKLKTVCEGDGKMKNKENKENKE